MPHVSATAVKLQKTWTDPDLRRLDLTADLNTARYIVLSDLHRGQGDEADDFRGCDAAYRAALEHYLDDSFTLIHLGDIEELWEVPKKHWGRIFTRYPLAYELERAFHDAGRYHRVFGNHDLPWADDANVARHLEPAYPGIVMHEAINVTITANGFDQGAVFLLHGHQGELFSDSLRAISRFFVESIWANVQRLFRVRSTSFSEMTEVENARDEALFYDWAVAQHRLIAIGGHTHRMVFETPGEEHAARVRRMVIKLEKRLALASRDAQLAHQVRTHLKLWKDRYARSLTREPGPDRFQAAFFNSGCCCYPGHRISGLELADGRIRLVVWEEKAGTTARRALGDLDLLTALTSTRASQPPGMWTSPALNVVIAD
ncbi:MAG: hypothetical protein L0271_21020 [Gemmatimonadetes bacterium]|nr:hypothetical protein [Gemmatimonadota bacterium]